MEDGWTPRTLFEHFTKIGEGQKEAVDAALHSLDKRLDTMNEFRQTVTDRDVSFARRDVVNPKMENHEERLQLLERAQASGTGRDEGKKTNMAAIYSAIAAMGVILGAIVVLMNVIT